MPELVADGQVQENALAGAVAPTSQHGSPDAAAVPAAESDPPPQAQKPRVLGPDLLRGLLMMLQAIDHCALSVGAWRHGVAVESEGDGQPVSEWNTTVAYTARMLTHLCAPGFMFLLGMGIVYFGRSRSKLGWGPARLAWHFTVRGVVLFLLNQVFLTLPAGRGGYWMMNAVLVALAANYVLAGLLWMALSALERTVATVLAAFQPQNEDNPERRSLLGNSTANEGASGSTPSSLSSADTIAWHLHNAILLILTIASAWWNMPLSPHGGRCVSVANGDTPAGPSKPGAMPFRGQVYGLAVDFWLYPVVVEHFVSVFPPLGWLSFAILGLLYGRLVTARAWRPYVLNTANAAAGVLLAVLFVMTRLLHFGNLSEGCLHMPEQLAQPTGANQYLASFRSFLYIVKYPPDLAFFALTMSANFFLLAFFGTWSIKTATRRIFSPLLVFGTSALYFYLLHMWVYTLLSIPAKHFFGHETGDKDPLTGGTQMGVGEGWVMWATYLIGLAILYPACRSYGRFKSAKAPDSVWRFF